MSHDTIEWITIPLMSAITGYVTNWTGVWMLFNPLHFKGMRIPGLSVLARYLPRRVQQIPGVMHGGVGWQGIIPSRAAKMGSIAVDKGIAKVGGASDFYEELEPETMAEHIIASSREDIRDIVERVLEREHPQLWHDVPQRVREAVHERVQEQLPEIVHDLTSEIGANIDQLLDPKLMVIRHIEERPELANRIFLETGRKELRFIINFGFFWGALMGVGLVPLVQAIDQWWVLLVGGMVVGWVTNYVAIRMIFEPVEPRKIGPFTFHGLFLRRRREVAEVYAGVISEDIITVSNLGNELMRGPRSDRTRQLIATALRPAIDRAVGPARAALRVAIGTREYDAIRESFAVESVDYTLTPLTDEEFDRARSAKIRELFVERMHALSYADFSEMLRSGIKQDEWLLFLHGAVLGLVAGGLHMALVG